MLKKIIAVPAGLFAGGIGIFLIQTLGHKLYPNVTCAYFA